VNIHPYSAASPELDATAMSDLAESIRTQGQLVPVLVWRGEVIDGRKRMAVCDALGIEPRVETLSDDADGARVAVDANVLRTHYTPSQRAMFAAGIANAKRGDIGGGRRQRADEQICSSAPVTEQQAADLLHVARTNVTAAKRIQRTAAPEVVDAVRRGDLTLHAAGKIAAEVPAPDQPRVTAEVVAAKKGTRNTPHAIISAVSPGFRNAPRRDVAASLERGIEAMLATVESLAEVADGVSLTEPQREHLTGTLRHIIRAARTLERTLSHGGSNERSA
jgi:ParB-like chromosome segregation protein Spo0J